MRDLKNKLTPGKNSRNIQSRRGKSFGYQVIGFGSGGAASPFIVATGGTESTSGDYKIHKFTGDGTFCVSAAGTAGGSNTVDYMVVAGGGAGGVGCGGAAGGGGGCVSSNYSHAGGVGGPGGGGAGAQHPGTRAVNGSANTGGGAGGDTNDAGQANEGGDGGSGKVVIKEEAGCSGMWTMNEVYEAEKGNYWPT